MPSKDRDRWVERLHNRAKMTPAEVARELASLAGKQRRKRARRRFATIYGRPPVGANDERLVRKLARRHPIQCVCYDCTYGPEECGDVMPRVARLHTA